MSFVQSEGARVLVPLVRRYPLVSGFAFIAVGALMINFAIGHGAELEEFVGGERTSGVVKEVLPESERQYRAVTVWRGADGEEQSGSIAVSRKEARKLKPGDSLELVLSRSSVGRALKARSLDGQAVVVVLGRPVTFLAWVGSVFVALGLALAAAPNWVFRDRSRAKKS